MSQRNNKTVTTVSRVFMVIGLLFLVGAVWAWSSASTFIAHAESAEGTVIELVDVRDSDGGYTYAPRVHFETAKGREIEFTSNHSSNPPSFHEDQRVRVLYDPQEPYEAKIDSFGQLWAPAVFLAVFGAIFFGIGGGIVWWRRARQATQQRLKAQGRRILADIQGVDRDTSIKVNGVSPWRLTAQWQDPATQKVHVFHSENLWFDPAPYLAQEQVTVYLDAKNLKKHWVDISFLPEMAG